MTTVNVTLPADGTTADVADYNTPILAMLAAINGGLDTSNFNLSSSMIQTLLSYSDGWVPTNESWALSTSNGQKEFNVTVSGDKTAKYTPGMRVKIPRSTTPPTQCSDMESSSSQFASKTTPTNIVFTDDWSAEAWIRLESYTGLLQTIISRYDGTNGFRFYISASGALGIAYATAGRIVETYQSLPLDRWVHVAVSSDASGAAVNFYVNGVLFPSITTGAAASLTQAGNLQIGAANSVQFLDGKITDVRLWNTTRTAAQFRDNANQVLVGNESGLIGYWKLDGNFNDLTSNANNLTASGAVTATTVDNPMKSTEYGIITAVSYSAPNTTLVIFTGTDYTIPNQTLGAPSYSFQKSPVGWPDENKWLVDTLILNTFATAFGALNTWTAAPGSFVIPIGAWKPKYDGSFALNSNTNGNKSGYFILSPTTPVNANYTHPMTGRLFTNSSVVHVGTVSRATRIAQAAQATWQLYSAIDAAPGVETFSLYGLQGGILYEAVSAYA